MQQIPFGHIVVLGHPWNHRDALGYSDTFRAVPDEWLVRLVSNFFVILGALGLLPFNFDIDSSLDESIFYSHVSKLRLLHKFILSQFLVFD